MRFALWFAAAGAFALACSGPDSRIDEDFDADGAAGAGAGQGGSETESGGGAGTEATAGSAGIGGDSGTAGLAGAAGSEAGGNAGSVGSAGSPATGGGSGGTPPTTPDPKLTAEMVYSTVNIGRDYDTKSDVQAVINHVGDVLGSKSGPKFIGWQEIGEADPCGGTCEIDSIHARFTSANGWTTRRPKGERPDGGSELVKVPITSKGSSDLAARAELASPGWAGVSPTRFVTVVRYDDRGLSVLNTHFIAGAWSCKSDVAKRKEYWQQAWKVLKAEVKTEYDLGKNVIVTGDLNRPRAANSCNPAWDPTSLHVRAQIIGGENIDYIFAVPAAGNRFVISTQNGTKLRGTIALGIDGHKGHWVIGRFLEE
jgi:hypothetical protein